GDPLTARLVFDGNAAIATATLVETTQRTGPLAAWLDPAGFALMLARVYHDAGLLSAEINVQTPQIQKGVSTIQVVIREGDPWNIGQVTVDGAGPLGDINAPEAFGLPESSRYSPKSVAERVAAFEQRFRDLGFLNAHVTAQISLDAPAQRVNLQ